MNLKTILAALALAATPALATAACFGDHAEKSVMSCAEGLVWDTQKGACVEQVTG